MLMQLPVYEPSEAEKKDPVLFAANVRQYMVSTLPIIIVLPTCMCVGCCSWISSHLRIACGLLI
jgi:hypothetical protein